MKKSLLLLLLLISLLTLAACGSQLTESLPPAGVENTAPADSPTAPTTLTVTDQAGNQVTVPADIQRIAVAGIYPLPSVLTVFFNSAEKIVAMPKASYSAAANGLLSQVYPEILNVETECVSGEQINTEELLKLNPDVVFYSASDTQIGEQLTGAGFTAVALSVNQWGYDCIQTLNSWIELLSQMFPQDAKAELVKEYSDEAYALVQERTAGLRDEDKARIFVLFQYTDTLMMSSGAQFFGQWWCDAINAINVAAELDTDNAVNVNLEQVYTWNPQVILVTNFTAAQPADLYQNTIGSNDWSGLDAVANQRVYKMPLGMYRSYTPGADTPITLLWLAQTVYPELFADIDVIGEAQEYYQTVFGLELSQEQLQSIFAPSSDAAAGL